MNKARVFLDTVMLLLIAGTLIFSAREVAALKTAQLSACKAAADIGSAPVAINPATGKASLLGVSIVADYRQIWHGNGCTTPMLGPPAPSFVRWAKFYGLSGR